MTEALVPDVDPDAAEPEVAPVLARLNAKGFRLVQLMDLLAVVSILVGSMWIRYRWEWPTYPMSDYVVSFVAVTAVFMFALYFGGMYEREPVLGRPPVFPRAMRQTTAAAGLVALGNLAITALAQDLGRETQRALPLPTFALVNLLIVGALAVTMNRALARWNQRRVAGRPRVLLVGESEEVETATRHVTIDEGRAEVVGHVADLDDLLGKVHRLGVTDVMLLSGRWLDAIYGDLLATLDSLDVIVHQRVTPQETMYGLQRVRQIGGMPFVMLRAHTIPGSRLRFKRFTDLLWLLLLSPFLLGGLLFTAVYCLVFVRRPLLFWQERVGVDGKPFQMVKFRTMVVHAEEDGRPQLSSQTDPRVIPACRWLRATRLDELPQLWNIVRGEMSLVGPRPERPEMTAQFDAAIPGYQRRHEVPPGLTGLAQIHGHYQTDPEYKLGYDLQYLVNWSPILDLEIVVRTIWVVLARRV